MDTTTVQAIYEALLPTIRETARGLGYAIAVHGSMQRDLDLIAAPWTDDAAPARKLVRELEIATGGVIHTQVKGVMTGHGGRDPERKPHGRLAWSIHGLAGGYIDLSVMPRRRSR